MTRPYDLIVFGATGFTGRLVADYLQQSQGRNRLRWALAGRQSQKLEQVRDAIGAPADLPLLTADVTDANAMAALVLQTRAVITTVGPYQRHGEALVTACAAAGTDYVDLCGEPLWMAQMIERLQAPAAASGARIVFSCGFDSIPFDLGVVFLQQALIERYGMPAREVRGRVKVMKGTMSGGTAASALATVAQTAGNAQMAAVLANPFALTPGFQGPPQPDDDGAAYDDWARAWTGPFMMAVIDTKNVHRTHALRGFPWGRGFSYSERLLTGTGRSGELRARGLARRTHLQDVLLGFGPTRKLIGRFVLPQPGQGPDAAAREAGRFEVLFTGEAPAGQRITAKVTGDCDPGYGSTCKMVSESALCLLQDVDHRATPGGVWTAGSAMGLALVRRLQAHAGITFTLQA
jgi:short subunit dehydrogenase-like uncharacterized protein